MASLSATRRLFTVDDYYRMAAAGILKEDDRVELIEGQIVQMSPIGKRHSACVDRLTELLALELRRRAILRVQSSIRLTEHLEPQPDVTLLKRRPDFYSESEAGPADMLLVIEVSDTSADYDRSVKVPLYAQAGIPELWLVDLEQEHVEVFRAPAVDGPGSYRSVQVYRRGERLGPAALPDVTLGVDDIPG